MEHPNKNFDLADNDRLVGDIDITAGDWIRFSFILNYDIEVNQLDCKAYYNTVEQKIHTYHHRYEH